MPADEGQPRWTAPVSHRPEGWAVFAGWALVGGLLCLSVLGAASIGLFILPVAVLALVVMATTVRVWPEVTGVLGGAAALVLSVGMANLGSSPCPERGVHVQFSDARGSFSCGGLDPGPWLLAGLILAGTGVLLYALLRATKS